MRTHLQIISDAGGYQAIAATLGLPAERTRFWVKREAIPQDQWPPVIRAGLATLDELSPELARAVGGEHGDVAPSDSHGQAAA